MKHFLQVLLLKLRQSRDLDAKQIGAGTRGPLTEKLQTLYFDCVHGRNTDYLEWINNGRCV